MFFTSLGDALAQTYCDSASTNANYEFVNEVSLNGATKLSGANTYSDFTGSVFTVLNRGETYSLSSVSMVVTQGGPWLEYVKAWIDFNHDGIFDANEEIDFGSATVSDTYTFTQDISVPQNATLGDTRMRVILEYNAAPSPCGTYTWGETEDYTISIVQSVDYYCDDVDGDGHFDPNGPTQGSCVGQQCWPVGCDIINADDCNDNNPEIFLGAFESCGDGIDQNCNGYDEPCSVSSDCNVDSAVSGTYVEAENYSSLGNSWTLRAGSANGGAYMEADLTDTATPPSGLPLEYNMFFPAAGDYYLWFLVHNNRNNGDNSLWYGLDNNPPTAQAVTSPRLNSWQWTNDGESGFINPAKVSVSSAGFHSITIWSRENNLRLDGFFLSSSQSATPTSNITNIDPSITLDNDGDNHSSIDSCAGTRDDCDDNNPNNFPGNSELCDNSDNNCDGQIDDNLFRATTCGVGECLGNTGTESCTAGAWGDDTCNPLFGASAEICDGLDNDCNGTNDNGLNFDLDGDGHTSLASCGGTKDDCDDNDPDNFPGNPETCDNSDNNCDGSVDENLTRATSCGLGECAGQTGVETCTAGAWGDDTCNPLFGASAEICDGLDNDCNGTNDNGLNFDLDGDGHTSLASCGGTKDDCDDNDPDNFPGNPETCDNSDNNCDGSVDENLTRATSCGLGECAGQTGVETCTAGAWGDDTCNPLFGASAEICDGLDNDCNGTNDDGLNFDVDGDGHTSLASCGGTKDDCDDNDPDNFPGNPETCDNSDNNCDGSVDENLTRATSCGLGECAGQTGVETCTAGAWGDDTCNPLFGASAEICDGLDNDCNGTNDDALTAPTNPNQTGVCSGSTQTCSGIGGWVEDYSAVSNYETNEMTCDTLDNDCDNSVDEGCECIPGQTQSCYTGPLGTEDVGICSGGIQTCQANSTWGACIGETLPQSETCDNSDNNCDGSIDENLTRANTCGLGECSGNTGTESCTAGVWGDSTCDEFAGASAEICDGLDNDCNGTNDDGLNFDVDGDGHTSLASCGGTKDDCDDNDPDNFPGNPETCDNSDNNCDGSVDENLTRATSCGLGECAGQTGVETCTAGAWGDDTCNPLFGASAEICDGLDNDCNGTNDDALTAPTNPNQTGVCSGSTQTCSGIGGWVEDYSAVSNYETNEMTCDTLDNDCDNSVDEGCECIPGQTQSCYTGPLGTEDVGICSGGIQTCQANSTWGACIGETLPQSETCDNSDNNCDGSIDENLTRANTCGLGECSGNTGTESCTAGVWGDSTCDEFAGASAEICDGLDNDCNGTNDDGLNFDLDGDGHTSFDSCSGSRDDCDDNDQFNFPGNIETCDNSDNNCDGSVDENLTRATTCGLGECAGQTGVETCTAGAWGDDTCNPLFGASAEICDGLDNDCNGTNDNGLNFDLDGDGHTSFDSCSGSRDDCDDNDPDNFPGNIETCDNSDNNCDGAIDENLTRATTCGLGECSGNTGTESCTAGVWGDNTCDEFAGASAEICDGLDNDCNGTNDNGLNFDLDGDGHTSFDSCSGSRDDCDDNDPDNFPGNIETCDNSDNNCDGAIDENLTRATTCGLGECSGNTGTESCTAGVWGDNTCDEFAGASAEICDGLDNNCNGIADEGFDGDGDTIADCIDACPADPNNDADGDGICGDVDICPNDSANDSDGDGICGNLDNCPGIPNPTQADCDNDNIGDFCDSQSACSNDSDGDGLNDSEDNCPGIANPSQDNADNDLFGDLCDACPNDANNDSDSDGICGNIDNCPANANPGQENTDGDLLGDACDACPNDSNNDIDNDGICGDIDTCPNDPDNDIDGDGSCGDVDGCPTDSSKTTPGICGCGISDTTDADSDGVVNCIDNCPLAINPDQADCDNDSIGNICDIDSPCSSDGDFDGVVDSQDNCPTQPNSNQANSDNDLLGDVCDPCPNDVQNDQDDDGICAGNTFNAPKIGIRDNCATIPNTDQANSDGDSLGDACDACPNDADNDADNDGICGDIDSCPNDPGNDLDADGICGDSDNCPAVGNAGQDNTDGDSFGDACDPCINDPSNDTDGDGLCADVDNCPVTSNNDQTDSDSDGLGDACDTCPLDTENDIDGDGVCGNVDECPVDPGKSVAGQCGCGTPDTDSDGDGVADCNDACPLDANDDADGDGFCANLDNCPTKANPDQKNSDNDLFGDVCDACPQDVLNDKDGDGVCGNIDNCPNNANADQANSDGDAIGDVCDSCPDDTSNDIDNDGICGNIDICPNDPDNDAADNDGICGDIDNCPGVANADQTNTDSDLFGDACDTCPADPFNDADGDGVCGDVDGCPEDGDKTEPGVCGCGIEDADSDSDGTLDCNDSCPNDPYKVDPGTSGCGTIEPLTVPVGINVAVTPIPELTLIIDEVTAECTLNVTVVNQPVSSSVYLPIGEQMYNLELQCPGGPVTGSVCIQYDETTVTTNERDVRILRNDQLGLNDITFSLDIDSNRVCGRTSSFTLFGPAEPKNSDGIFPDYIPVPEGNDVAISTTDASADLTFPGVETGGCNMEVFIMDKPVPPVDYRLLGDQALDIDLSCSPDGYVCLDYDESEIIGAESDLILWHRGLNGWEDITDSVDTDANSICGYASSFSPFAIGELSDYSGLHLIPYPSALSSPESDLTVTFEATRSSCYEEAFNAMGIMYTVDLNCSFTWDFGGSGTIMGGNGDDVVVYMYNTPGTYTATVSITEDSSGLTESSTVVASAIEVEPPPPSADFDVLVSGNEVTLTSNTLTPDIMRVYVFWGDRERDISKNPLTDFSTGLSHSYTRSKDYNIRVKTIDSNWNELNYTFIEDNDLSIEIQ
ncbi:MAG: thrombospondin type 3 repeat-containing protein [Desulfobulbaceae bacterium]|nr:thrombospondin type 3 repeat-containing protein [Desulfobulbaceae bacterium]